MKVLIFGAAGRTGRHVVKQAILQHHRVTAFVRSPADFEMAAAHLAVFTGNVTDGHAVARAMKDHDVVISVLGTSRKHQRDPSVVQGVRYILHAMQERGVRRLIYQSCLGVAESRPGAGLYMRTIGARVLRHELADHEEKEALIRATSLDWTIVRPARLTKGERTGRYRGGEHVCASGFGGASLSRADAAEFLLKHASDSSSIRRVLAVIG
jgi:putative NADH-flavin reductase